MTLSEEDLILNDQYLNELSKYSRIENVRSKSIENDNANNNNDTTLDTIAAFTFETRIIIPVTCNHCGFSWNYTPRKFDPNRRHVLCCKCRQAVRLSLSAKDLSKLAEFSSNNKESETV